MADLAGARLKLKRAKFLIDHFDKEWDVWFAIDAKPPYEIVEEHLEGGDFVLRFKVVREMPEEWPCIIGDAIYNMRSSLDHLVWQLILKNNRTPDPYSTMFVTRDNHNRYREASKRAMAGMSPLAKQYLDNLKPYGVDSPFFAMNTLCNIDKHRVLLVVYSSVVAGGVKFKPGQLPHGFKVDPVSFFNRGTLADGSEVVRIPKELVSAHTGSDFTVRPMLQDDPSDDARAGIFPRLRWMLHHANQAVDGADQQFF